MAPDWNENGTSSNKRITITIIRVPFEMQRLSTLPTTVLQIEFISNLRFDRNWQRRKQQSALASSPIAQQHRSRNEYGNKTFYASDQLGDIH